MNQPFENEIALDKARLGIEAEAFLDSNLGRYLMERAELEIEIATQELIATEPTEIALCIRIRNRILVTELFQNWLTEAVQEGKVASQELERLDHID